VSDKPEPLPKMYSLELQYLVFKLLEKDPTKRPDAFQILNNFPAVKVRVSYIPKILIFQKMELLQLKKRDKDLSSYVSTLETKLKQYANDLDNATRFYQDELSRFKSSNHDSEFKTQISDLTKKLHLAESRAKDTDSTVDSLKGQVASLSQILQNVQEEKVDLYLCHLTS
jgi:hypothetical protein